MNNTFTAVIKEENGWWIGWVEEIPGVNCQEKTREELMKTISVTLKEAIQLNKEEALRAARSGYSEAFVQV